MNPNYIINSISTDLDYKKSDKNLVQCPYTRYHFFHGDSGPSKFNIIGERKTHFANFYDFGRLICKCIRHDF